MQRINKAIVVSTVVGLVATLCLCGVIPIQTYVAVSECFRFSLGELLSSYLSEAVGLFAVVTVVLSGLAVTRLGLRPHIIVLATVLACLLEVGFLSIGLPPLNGDISLYGGTLRRLVDSAILGGIIIVGCVYSRILARHLVWCVLAVVCFAGSSLLDVRSQRGLNAVSEDAPAVGNLRIVPRHDVVRSGCYSPSNNVLVLIVDSVTREVASDILRADPKLAAEFPGFVVYEDNLGMHPSSDTATAGFMTGRYCENPFQIVDFVRSQFTEKSFAATYDAKGYPVFVNVAVSSLGLTNRLKSPSDNATVRHVAAKDVRIDDAFPWSISEIVRFRVLPYALKRKYLKHLLLVWEGSNASSAFIHSDKTLWPYLANQPIDSSVGMTLHVNHSPGGHPPLHFDESGNWTQILEPNYENYRRQCVYVFRQLADLMRTYRSRGLYDVSTILIMADHGGIRSESSPTRDVLPGSAIPMLMVKPHGGAGPLRASSSHTSHSRIFELARELCEKNLTAQEIESILVQTNRLYRAMSGNMNSDWVVDRNGSLLHAERRFDRDDSALAPIEYGTSYEFEQLGTGIVPDYRGMVSVPGHSNGCVRVRLPDRNTRRLHVELDFLVGQGRSALTTGFSEMELGGGVHRIEKVHPFQKVHIASDCEIAGEWLDVTIDSSRADFYLSLKQMRVTQVR